MKRFFLVFMSGVSVAGAARETVPENLTTTSLAIARLHKPPLDGAIFWNRHHSLLAECMMLMALEPGQHPAVSARAVLAVAVAERAGHFVPTSGQTQLLAEHVFKAAHKAQQCGNRIVEPFLIIKTLQGMHPENSSIVAHVQNALRVWGKSTLAPVLYGVKVVVNEMSAPTDRYRYEVGRDGVASIVMRSRYAQKK